MTIEASTVTTLTAGAVANTKAATYTTVIASTAFAATMMRVMVTNASTTAAGWLVDVAVGAALSEVDVVTNLLVTGDADKDATDTSLWIPVVIASGSRVSARCQASTGGINATCVVHLANYAWQLGTVTTLGADTSDSGGLVVDPGATPGTPGAFVQFSASLPTAVRWITLIFGTRVNTAMTGASWTFDVATADDAGTIIVPGVVMTVNVASDSVFPGVSGPYPVTLSAATALWVRSTSTTADATDRLIDVVVVTASGVPATSGATQLVSTSGLVG